MISANLTNLAELIFRTSRGYSEAARQVKPDRERDFRGRKEAVETYLLRVYISH